MENCDKAIAIALMITITKRITVVNNSISINDNNDDADEHANE